MSNAAEWAEAKWLEVERWLDDPGFMNMVLLFGLNPRADAQLFDIIRLHDKYKRLTSEI